MMREMLTKLSIGAWRLTYTRQALAHLYSDHRQTTVHLQNDMINMVAAGVMQSFNGTMICVLFMPT